MKPETGMLTKDIIKKLLIHRQASTNKGDYGHSIIFAGNTGKMGAAVIAARACLRSGTGLLTVNVPKEERMILQTAIPEAMLSFRSTSEYDFSRFSAAGIGPGIGTDKKSDKMVFDLLEHFNKPLLLDADALNIVAAHRELLKKVAHSTIFTPHPKEFDRLFGKHDSETERRSAAINLANEHNIVIVLKGHQTLITARGISCLNTTGNAGLAKGGSGDALTGIITAFLAQGYEPFIAAKIGVYLHGLAADIALGKQSMESMLVTDVIDCLGAAFNHVQTSD
ncbi:NAD(P)H-hydrate dehydratase [Dyadobacter frigoris]|uniref:ADP-dependent (S)-NAD(P)H-hydrate dehydratase n=1 Tax=Dyadobacter frigoris TaxID=2576211 RepID=A0A4U6CQV3_9BACT|nr:NAD(P)H-hydrate dehydratase [Dyadobacter frigoris]TKT86526.1 NAD(P)H-hydrate dehydratase [Dyadobacter frigoris]